MNLTNAIYPASALLRFLSLQSRLTKPRRRCQGDRLEPGVHRPARASAGDAAVSRGVVPVSGRSGGAATDPDLRYWHDYSGNAAAAAHAGGLEPMTTREEVRERMAADGVEYILVQFVDINGSPKVKMVPASHLDDVIDEGAGFAGAALYGLGQGPHSHDMLARVDLDTYTFVPWREGVARFAGGPVRGRRGPPLLRKAEPQARAWSMQGTRGTNST